MNRENTMEIFANSDRKKSGRPDLALPLDIGNSIAGNRFASGHDLGRAENGLDA
jgi:hypothetical protein